VRAIRFADRIASEIALEIFRMGPKVEWGDVVADLVIDSARKKGEGTGEVRETDRFVEMVTAKSEVKI
jgi:hypothetical protein